MDDVWTTHGHRANLTCIVESVKNRLHHGSIKVTVMVILGLSFVIFVALFGRLPMFR